MSSTEPPWAATMTDAQPETATANPEPAPAGPPPKESYRQRRIAEVLDNAIDDARPDRLVMERLAIIRAECLLALQEDGEPAPDWTQAISFGIAKDDSGQECWVVHGSVLSNEVVALGFLDKAKDRVRSHHRELERRAQMDARFQQHQQEARERVGLTGADGKRLVGPDGKPL